MYIYIYMVLIYVVCCAKVLIYEVNLKYIEV